MSAWMRPTLRCLAVEPLKLKRSLAPVLAVVLPAIPGSLQLLGTLQNGAGRPSANVDPAGWFLHGAFAIWCFLLLPLYVALQCSLVAGVEHQSQGWRQVLTLPVPRSSVFLAKFLTHLALLAGGFAVLLAGTYLALRAAATLRPDVGLEVPFPWIDAYRLTALTFLASLFLLAVHSFVALRWASFALNIALAIVGVVMALALSDTRLIWLYPWSLPVAVQGSVAGHAFGWGSPHSLSRAYAALLEGGGAALLLVLLGGRVLVRRDVA